MHFDPTDFYYIPVDTKTKAPVGGKWGGYPVDTSNELICTYEQVRDSTHQSWGIVGNIHKNLLIIDIDLAEMGHRVKYPILKNTFADTIFDTTLVQTPSGGVHLYYEYDGNIEQYEQLDHVDLCGDVGQRYAKSIFCEGYTLVHDNPPLPIDDTLLEEFPVFQKAEDLAVVITEEDRQENLLLEPPCIRQARQNDNTDLLAAYVISQRYRDGIHLPDGDIYDLLDESEYPENRRVAAPSWMHHSPSATNSNFMVDRDKETFRCWRHSITGNVYHLIAFKHDIAECTQVGTFSTDQWRDTLRIAEEEYGIGIREKEYELTCQQIKEQGDCPVSCGRVSPHE